MSKQTSSPNDASAFVEILTSKSASIPRFDDSDRTAIAEHQRALADRQWSESLRSRIEALQHLALLHAGQDEGPRHSAASLLRREFSHFVEQARPGIARLNIIGPSPIGCDSHSTSPPYPIGDPLQEVVGVDATAPPDFNNLTTFTRLASPDEGQLSLGVGLGKVGIDAATRTLHPPAMEYPQTFPIKGGVLEVTNARASLGHFLGSLPGAPLQVEKLLNVSVNVTAGAQSRPFYLVMPPPIGPPILQAFGVAHLFVFSSDGGTAQKEVVFLEHREGSNQIFGTPTVMHEFSVAQTLTLQPGTSWVYAGIDVRLEIHRWFILPPPPDVVDREGFVMIDLRSPQRNTRPIHHLLAPGGPVTVSRIGMTICRPDAVFA